MIEKFEEYPEPVRIKYINKKALKNVNVGRIRIEIITGKQGNF